MEKKAIKQNKKGKKIAFQERPEHGREKLRIQRKIANVIKKGHLGGKNVVVSLVNIISKKKAVPSFRNI